MYTDDLFLLLIGLLLVWCWSAISRRMYSVRTDFPVAMIRNELAVFKMQMAYDLGGMVVSGRVTRLLKVVTCRYSHPEFALWPVDSRTRREI